MQECIIWCLSQARINWEGCSREGIWHKNGEMTGFVSASVIFTRTRKSTRWRAIMEEVDKGCREFCTTVGTVTRTASIVGQRHWLLIWAGHPTNFGCMPAWLGLTTLAGSKQRKGDVLPRYGPCCLCESFFIFLMGMSGFHTDSAGQTVACVWAHSKYPVS